MKWYNELMKSGLGRKGGPKMNISLVAAYAYHDQINIMITSRSKYGDTVYCRYFDEFRKEIGVPFETVIFPEFNAHCELRDDVAFMSLTDTPSDAYDFPVPVIDRTRSGEKSGINSKQFLCQTGSFPMQSTTEILDSGMICVLQQKKRLCSSPH
ncbi:hypothetical protein V3C99_007813 [Haemonchus contortus]